MCSLVSNLTYKNEENPETFILKHTATLLSFKTEVLTANPTSYLHSYFSTMYRYSISALAHVLLYSHSALAVEYAQLALGWCLDHPDAEAG